MDNVASGLVTVDGLQLAGGQRSASIRALRRRRVATLVGTGPEADQGEADLPRRRRLEISGLLDLNVAIADDALLRGD